MSSPLVILILETAEDAGRDFAYGDRKEDERLSQGDLIEAVESGEVTLDEIASAFLQGLKQEGVEGRS
jgi:hypothetical protein